MRTIIITTIMVFLCLSAKSQNKRWMYITMADDHSIMMIDTISSEIKQDKEDVYLKKNGFNIKDYATNTVTFWVMNYKKRILKGKSIVTKDISKITVDTVKSQYQSADRITYRNNNVVSEDNITIDWTDIVPGTLSELFIKFARSLHNQRLKNDLTLNANYNNKYFPNLSPLE